MKKRTKIFFFFFLLFLIVLTIIFFKFTPWSIIGFDDYITLVDFSNQPTNYIDFSNTITEEILGQFHEPNSGQTYDVYKYCYLSYDKLFTLCVKTPDKNVPQYTDSYMNDIIVKNIDGKKMMFLNNPYYYSMTLNQNLKGADVKIVTYPEVRCDSGRGICSISTSVIIANELFSYGISATTSWYEHLRDYTFNIKSSFLDSNIIQIEYLGIEREINLSGKSLTINFHKEANIRNIKYKLPFDCVKREDEVIVRDKFTPNSILKVSSLTYLPTRMCLDFAPKFVADNGIQLDSRGELLYKIARNQEYIIPSTMTFGQNTFNIQYLIFEYITPYVNIMTERCNDPAFAYDTQLKRCVQRVEQIAPTEVILQCQTNSDCAIGFTGKCGVNIQWNCISNKCQYSNTDCSPEQIINEKIVYQTQYQIVQQYSELMNNEFLYYHDFNSLQSLVLFGTEYEFSQPSYRNECNPQGIFAGYINNPECFTQVVNGNSLESNKEYELNKYLKVKWGFNGRGVRLQDGLTSFFTENDWGGIFKFKIDKFLFLQKPTDDYYIKLNENHYLKLVINNDLSNVNGGIKVTSEPQRVFQDKTTINYDFGNWNNGDNEIAIPISTSQLGVLNVLLEPYFKVLDYKFMTGDKLIISYNVYEGQRSDDIILPVVPIPEKSVVPIPEKSLILKILIYIFKFKYILLATIVVISIIFILKLKIVRKRILRWRK